MKALRLHGVGDLRLHDEAATRSPRPRRCSCASRAVGLCGSDRHWFARGRDRRRRARRGRSCSGTSSSRRSIPGRARASASPSTPRSRAALRCSAARGLAHLCPNLRFAGHGSTDGALRTLMAWPERPRAPDPRQHPRRRGHLLEPLGVALHALELGHVGPADLGRRVRLRARSASCSSRRSGRLAPPSCSPRTCSPTASRRRPSSASRTRSSPSTVPSRPHVEAERPAGGSTSPSRSPVRTTALDDAIGATRPGGRVVLVGIPGDDRTSLHGFRRSPQRPDARSSAGACAASDLPRAIRLVAGRARRAFAARHRAPRARRLARCLLCAARSPRSQGRRRAPATRVAPRREPGRLRDRGRLRHRVGARRARRLRRRSRAAPRTSTRTPTASSTRGCPRRTRPSSSSRTGRSRIPADYVRTLQTHDPAAPRRGRRRRRATWSGSASTSPPARCSRPSPTGRRSARLPTCGASRTRGSSCGSTMPRSRRRTESTRSRPSAASRGSVATAAGSPRSGSSPRRCRSSTRPRRSTHAPIG